ncbi:MAG: iron-sulfur cluster repair di-iron protein [Ginsengibacter sp.]
MNQLITKSLSDIVNEQFQAASIFEKYHLDYCCKGRRSLQKACEDENLPVDKIIADLQNIFTTSKNEMDFNSIKLYQLADYIVQTHHGYVKKESPLIIAYLQKVCSKHADKHLELHQVNKLFTEVADEMVEHMRKEEVILFPRIKQLEQNGFEPIAAATQAIGYFEMPFMILENEHEDAGNKLDAIRKLTNNYTPPEDSCTTYKLMYACLHAFETDLHQHVHLENVILFPKVLMLEKEIQKTAHN